MGLPHKTIKMMVWVDVDEGISKMVRQLNQIRGVRTYSSCQGSIGEGGPHPYRAYVQCSWETLDILKALKLAYDVRPQGSGYWGYVHPLNTVGQPDGDVS